jgi:hypothetical protein
MYSYSYVYLIFRKLVKDLVLGMLCHGGNISPHFRNIVHSTFIFRVKHSMKESHVARKGYYVGMGRARTVAGELKGQ